MSDGDRISQCSQHSIAILHAYMHKYAYLDVVQNPFTSLRGLVHKSSVRISIHTSPSASVQRKDDEIPRHYITSVSQKHTHAMKMECKGFVQVHVKLKPFLGHECSNP